MRITEEQRELLSYKINDEGIVHAVIDYSNWDDIVDIGFHEHKKEFIAAYKKFETYLKQQGLKE